MSDKPVTGRSGQVIPSTGTPTPQYHYQDYRSGAGSASARPDNKVSPERKFAELQNLVLRVA